MTTSTKFRNSIFALMLASAPLMTVNNLAWADSEASLQAGSQATTENSDQSQHSSSSNATTENSAQASHESTSRAMTQNQSQAGTEAGIVPTGVDNRVPVNNPAPFAVGQEAQNLARKNAMPKAAGVAPKTTVSRAATVKAPKTKTVTYHWGKSAKTSN